MLHKTDLSRADLNLLVLFEVVMDERNVARAAGRLNLSASAVSHGLGRLRRLLNDPLFLRTPKGVVPTERALALAGPIDEVLARVRSVLSSAEPFDAATTRRRFVLGAPDGVSAVLLPRLLKRLKAQAPSADLSLRQLLPLPGETSIDRAWRDAFAALESRAVDVAVLPLAEVAARFHARQLYEEDFVIACRVGHPFARKPDLKSYCAMEHLVVSARGDPRGFVDEALTAQGLSRRVALTVPDFVFAISVVVETDLLCAVPRRFFQLRGPALGLCALEPPLPLPHFPMTAVVLKSGLPDLGLSWFLDQVSACA